MASLALSSISWEVTPAAKRIHFTNLYEWTMESRDLIHVIFVHHWQELLSYGENKVDFSAKTLKISQDSIPPWHPTCIVFLMARLEMFWTSIELVNLGDVGERYYRVWKIWWSLSIYRKAIVWPINKVMYKQLQIGWHGVFFLHLTWYQYCTVPSQNTRPLPIPTTRKLYHPCYPLPKGRKISKCFTSRAEASFSGTKVTLNFGSDNLGHGGPVSK